jgi:glutamate-5-semialdehyde dehydrogenase
MDIEHSLYQLARASRAAARPVARAAAEVRSAAIGAMADGLERHASRIATANAADMERARADGLSAPLVDRLDLQGPRLAGLVAAVREIAAQPDPVGQTTAQWTRPNGLEIKKVRLPLGVVLMIYEARPNVTLDAAALCIRSGNAVILRGGSEAARTNAVLAEVVQEALAAQGLPSAAVQLVPTQAREAIDLLVRFDDCIDLVIPRGGEGLIRRVVERSRIPVVRHYKGVCHVYVHAAADLNMAAAIAENAKVQRPGVCNAMETLLVDQAVAAAFLPPLVSRLERLGVEVRGCEHTREHAPSAKAATAQDWDTEFLGLTLAVRVVPDLEAAIAHIDAHGTQHSASIVSHDAAAIADFTHRVDASCVLVNASTRFNDGGELGLGAEMGISTTRVHAFGPMGAASLTAEKFVVLGQGQVRS